MLETLEKICILPKKKEVKPTFQILIFESRSTKNNFDGKILGKTLVEWVKFACVGYDCRIVSGSCEQLLNVAKNEISQDFTYTILLLSSTPLLRRDDIKSLIDYATYKNINLCKLPVGYIIKNKYLLEEKDCSVDSVYSANIDNFYIVENKKQYTYALNVLMERINSFHIANGVEIVSPNNTYIEPDVDISKGVIIYAGNSLKGKTTIGENVILKENNVIDNSKISKNCGLSGSVIENTILDSSVYVSAFCTIKNTFIGANSLIGNNCTIVNQKLDASTKLPSNTVLGEK